MARGFVAGGQLPLGWRWATIHGPWRMEVAALWDDGGRASRASSKYSSRGQVSDDLSPQPSPAIPMWRLVEAQGRSHRQRVRVWGIVVPDGKREGSHVNGGG